ncbi:MAG: CPBP family intramembrane metalloprotease [Clostridia bacterium]|nr:CPBP family intramembrane metalloprotease [Clostridia bacterium]
MSYETLAPFGSLPPERNPYYKNEQRNNLARIGFALIAYLILTSCVQAALTVVSEWLFPTFAQTEAFNWILLIVPSYGIGFPFFFLFLARMPQKRPESKKLSKEGWLAFLGVAFFLMLAGNMISIVLMEFFESLRGSEISNAVKNYMDRYSPLISFVTMVLIAPIIEELMFRKLMIDRLLPYSETLAVVTGSLFFGLIHGNFYQFFYSTMLGLLFSYVYIKTGKLRYTVIMHMIINFTGTTIASFLAEVTSEEAAMATSINPWVGVAGIYSMATYILAGCGLIFLIRKRKALTLSGIGERYLTIGTQFKLAWINAGTIVFCILCLLTFIMSLFI